MFCFYIVFTSNSIWRIVWRLVSNTEEEYDSSKIWNIYEIHIRFYFFKFDLIEDSIFDKRFFDKIEFSIESNIFPIRGSLLAITSEVRHDVYHNHYWNRIRKHKYTPPEESRVYSYCILFHKLCLHFSSW